MYQASLRAPGSDTIVFFGDYGAPIDSTGIVWGLSTIDGWDSPDVRVNTADRPASDGVFAGDFYYGPRIMELSGGFLAPNRNSLSQARNRLAAIVSRMRDTNYVELEVQEEIARRINVRRSGRLLMRTLANGVGCEFQIPMIAPDPRKLSNSFTVTVSGNTGDLYNVTGNYSTSPTIHVDSNNADGDSFEFVNIAPDGAEQRLKVILASAPFSLDVDMATRSVRSLGSTVRGAVVSGTDFFDLIPGGNDFKFFTNATGALATMTVSPAWI